MENVKDLREMEKDSRKKVKLFRGEEKWKKQLEFAI